MNSSWSYSAILLLFLSFFAMPVCSRCVAGQEGGSLSGPEAVMEECPPRGDLIGSAADKRVVAMRSAPAGTFPDHLQPTVIGPELPPEMSNSIRSVKVSGEQKLLALTFDLCERERQISGYDSEVVNFLRANKIKATFFASGKWMRSHPEKTMQLMSDPLFEIGNHGWSHRNLRMLDRKRAEEEILWTQAQYELLWEDLQKLAGSQGAGNSMATIPRVPKVFRFPFGTCNAESLSLLRSFGLPAIQWDVVSGDAAKGQTASAIVNIVMKQAKSGSIIVFHANGRGHGTADSLPIFVPQLRRNGFTFVTVSELLSSGTPVAVPDCYELRPRDNLRYDRLFRD